jgi:hypothetical protein
VRFPGLVRVSTAWSAIALAFAFFTWRSWRTWPDLLVDFGRELYIPWRLCEGDVLYREIAFTMGPLSQYANALLFKVFGVSLTTLIWANLTILAAIVAMSYWLFRRCGTPWSATFGILFFLAAFAFGHYSQIGNYNYVCPYRHEITHGLALGLLELICLVRFAETRKTPWLSAAGLCLGLIALTKLETFLPAAVAGGAAISLIAWESRNRTSVGETVDVPPRASRVGHSAGTLIVSTFLPVVIASIWLAVPLGWRIGLEGLAGNWRLSLDPELTIRSGFYQTLAGWDQPVANLLLVFLSAILVVAGVVLAYLVDTLLRKFSRSKTAVGVVGAIAWYGGTWLVAPTDWSFLPLGWPVLLTIVALVVVSRFWRAGAPANADPALCLVTIYALCLLPKILLTVGWRHYGFALAMPGTLVLIHVVVHMIPDALRRRTGGGSVFRAIAVGLLAACGLAQFRYWDQFDQGKTLPFGDGGDLIYVEPRRDNRAVPTVETLEYLRHSMQRDDTLVVIPEGTTLNYLLRKRNPTPFLMVTPWEFDAHGGESVVSESIVRSAPTYIAIVTMDMTIHGRGNFGDAQYGKSLREFIDAEYQAVHTSSTLDETGTPVFSAVVYRRNHDPE